jgi:GNAT superfamily N-acetyltransferase
LVIDGFEHPPTLLTPHNPPYYAQLIEAGGFEKIRDWYAWWFDEPAKAVRRLRRIAQRRSTTAVTIRPVNMRAFEAEAARIRGFYNRAWEKNWGFVPFTEAEFQHMARELRPLVFPPTVLFAEVEGRPVGFILALPDVNVILRELNGRLTRFGIPTGLFKLLYRRFRIRKARLIALGVVPEFRRHGIAERLVLRVMEEGMIKRGYTPELSMTLEDNHLINRLLEAIGAHIYKRYRIYTRRIDE